MSIFNAARWRHCLAVATALLGFATSSHAVPSYSRQTGSECAACHAGAFGQTLTPYGIRFKLGGYTDTDGKAGKVPLSAQLVLQQTNPANGTTTTRLEEADVYLAGRLGGPVGAFAKLAQQRDDDGTTTQLQRVDVRLAQETRIAGHQAVSGLSLNNTPGQTDPYSPPLAQALGVVSIGGGTMLNPNGSASMANRAIGLNAYTLVDNRWYGELGSYR